MKLSFAAKSETPISKQRHRINTCQALWIQLHINRVDLDSVTMCNVQEEA
jgi:hypothetical protein